MERGCLATQEAEGVQRVHTLSEDKGKTQDAILGEKEHSLYVHTRGSSSGNGQKKNVSTTTKNQGSLYLI